MPAGKKAPALGQRQRELIAKALAEPRRVLILENIGGHGEPMPCAELCTMHDISQATLSHHVKELETAGLIRGTRQGKFMIYELEREVLREYAEGLAGLTRRPVRRPRAGRRP